jgi:hypothetical protein
MSRRISFSMCVAAAALLHGYALAAVTSTPAPVPAAGPVAAPAPTVVPAQPSQAPALKNDPFARPNLSSPRGAPPAAGVPAAPTAAGKAPAATSWNPELSAVMLAGKDSMVKVGGVLVRMGEVVDGHRLVAVRESQAEFISVQNKKRVVLSLSGRELLGPAFKEDDRTIERRDDSRERQQK